MLVLSAGAKNKVERVESSRSSGGYFKVLSRAYKKDFTEKVTFDKRPGKKFRSQFCE